MEEKLIEVPHQFVLWPDDGVARVAKSPRTVRKRGVGEPSEFVPMRGDESTTFARNTLLPVHRWYRYSAGFSAQWASDLIREHGGGRILDPFVGSGTTLLAAEKSGADAIGVEAHPFIFRVAQAKLLHTSSPAAFQEFARRVREEATTLEGRVDRHVALIRKCYPDEALRDLDCLRQALENARDDSAEWRLSWLALVGVLRACSPVGTAQWQYVLPRKEKRKPVSPFSAFHAQCALIFQDMSEAVRPQHPAKVIAGDARSLAGVPDDWADLVVTSPPYPNNYDYADATRLEMSFFGEVANWGDLQNSVRRHLVRACTQHVPERAIDLADVLGSSELEPVRNELNTICSELARVRESKGGRKTYHLMVACYFLDMALMWRALRRVTRQGGKACFVLGDSAPYGVHVPVQSIMSELALSHGFRECSFEKTRDRNIKWKNRKHRVPLQEGRLWIQG